MKKKTLEKFKNTLNYNKEANSKAFILMDVMHVYKQNHYSLIILNR